MIARSTAREPSCCSASAWAGRGRRAESREQLRAAVATFEQLGAAGWADRARAALRASGEAAERGDPSSLSRLAPQELQIARLVAQGLSNREVAARLFLSPRTVDAQLRNIFALLGIASRVELAQFELAPDISSDVLRSRLARAGLAELFRDLRTMRGGALQDALARTLGRSGARGGSPAAGRRRVRRRRGDRVVLPAPGGDRAVVSVERDGHEVAALIYDAALDEDPELVEAVCAAATIVLENEHLAPGVAGTPGRAAGVEAADRRGGRCRAAAARAQPARRRTAAPRGAGAAAEPDPRRHPPRPSSAEALVTTASEQLAQSLEELRELARGIHPAVLEHGLDSALESLASRSPVPTAVFCDGSERLPEQLELALYFVACEALANVAKYAQATARVGARVARAERGRDRDRRRRHRRG